MAKQINADTNGAGMYSVQSLVGQYVRRKQDAAKTYKVASYDKSLRRWQLDDCDDCSRCVNVKTDTMLFAGFTY